MELYELLPATLARPPGSRRSQTPYRGIGANAALYVAHLLTEALISVARGQTSLIAALSEFERNMIERGFAAVRSSLADLERFHEKSGFRRFAMKSVFRVVDAIPPLQGMFRGER